MAMQTQQTAPRSEHSTLRARPLFDPPIVKRAVWESVLKLNPATLLKNPVIFVVEIVSVVVTILVIGDIVNGGPIAFDTAIAAGPVVHGPVRELRRSDGGGPGEGPSRHPAANAEGPRRASAGERRRRRRPSPPPA